MDHQLFHALEEKINQALELIELQRMQLEESEEKNASLSAEISALKLRSQEWEQSLTTILRKLDRAELADLKASSQKTFEQIVLEPELEIA